MQPHDYGMDNIEKKYRMSKQFGPMRMSILEPKDKKSLALEEAKRKKYQGQHVKIKRHG